MSKSQYGLLRLANGRVKHELLTNLRSWIADESVRFLGHINGEPICIEVREAKRLAVRSSQPYKGHQDSGFHVMQLVER